jgi:GDP-D-mannose dehydratase
MPLKLHDDDARLEIGQASGKPKPQQKYQETGCDCSPSSTDPLASNEANVTGTLDVLVAAKDCGVPAVVAASSSSVYGDTPVLPG